MADDKDAAWRRRDMALRLSHPIAAVVHLASATFILLYGLNAADNCIRSYDVSVLPGFEITKWYFRCYDRDAEKYTESTSCAVRDRAFYAKGWRTQFDADADDKCPDVRPKGPSINILVFAALFAYWSGLWHVVASVSAFGVSGGKSDVPGRAIVIIVQYKSQRRTINLNEGDRVFELKQRARAVMAGLPKARQSVLVDAAAKKTILPFDDFASIKNAARKAGFELTSGITLELKKSGAGQVRGFEAADVLVFTQRFQQAVRWLDYVVSAPVMLAVLAVLFSAPSQAGVRAMPAALALLLLAGWAIEPEEPLGIAVKYHSKRRPRHGGVGTPGRSMILLAVTVLYFATWAPAWEAIQVNSDKIPEDATGQKKFRAKAPAFISTMLGIVIAVFSSFVVVYFLDFDWFGDPKADEFKELLIESTEPKKISFLESPRAWLVYALGGRERMYTALSMTAKVILHTFIGIAVVRQTKTLGTNRPGKNDKPPDDVTENDIWVAFGAVVAGAFVINAIVIPLAARLAVKPTPVSKKTVVTSKTRF